MVPELTKLNLCATQEARGSHTAQEDPEEVVHGAPDLQIGMWASHLCSMLSISKKGKNGAEELSTGYGEATFTAQDKMSRIQITSSKGQKRISFIWEDKDEMCWPVQG